MADFFHLTSDGLQLAVETFGDGPPLIFAHGLTGNRHTTRKQCEPLSGRFRVIAFDQRGHGDSTPVTDPTFYSLPAMAMDIGTIMDALGAEKAVVGGASMGAATALRFALDYPERVAALLLTGPFLADTPNQGAALIRRNGQVISSQGMDFFLNAAASAMEERGVPLAVIKAIAAEHRSHNPASLAVACQVVMDWTMPDISRAKDLRIPVALIGWPGDPLHPLELAQKLADWIPGAQLELLPSFFNVYTDPASLGRIFQHFLEEISF